MRNWVFAGVALLAAVPAQAHWQYTRWGMTPTQVIASSKGQARAAEGDKSAQGDATRDVAGEYSVGERTFKASFWFDASGLQEVTLSPAGEPHCLELRRDLLAKYGEPVERSFGSVQRLMWADKPSGNRVVVITDGDGFCELQYAPLVSRTGSGL